MTDHDEVPGRSLPLLLLGVAAVLAGTGVGVIVAISGDEAPQELATTQPAPRAGEAKSVERRTERVISEGPAPGEDRTAFNLRMARHFQGSQDEAEALRYLGGSDPAVVEARRKLMAHCADVLTKEEARARALASEGRWQAVRDVLAALRRRLPGSFQARVDVLAGELREPETGPKQNTDQAEFKAKLQALLAKGASADAHYQLGVWARERNLLAEAKSCFTRAVAVDAFHTGARQALGHRRHQGRWYTPEQYAKAIAAAAKKPDPVKPTPQAARFPLPPPSPYQEDKGWYKDGAAACTWDEAPAYESKYYTLKTNIKEEYAKRYCKMMDQYFKRFLKVFKPFLPNVRYEKSEIWIHANRTEFRKQYPQYPPTAGGFYSPKTKRVHAYHGLFGQTGTTRTVLAHEGTHQFEDIVLRGKFWNAPIWIIEGLAVFFESATYTKNDVRIGLIPRERLWALKRGLAMNKLIPLTQLIRTTKRQFTGYHYAHAWALIYMVIYYGKSSKVRRRCQRWFSELFADALEGPVKPRDVERKIGGVKALRELEEKWKAWIKDLPYDYDPKKNR